MLNANDGAATLSAPVVTPTNIEKSYAFMDVGDVNSDARPDVVILVRYNSQSMVSTTYLGRGDGTFEAPIRLAVTANSGGGLADVTGDGVLDLLIHGVEETTIHRGLNNGTFGSPWTVPLTVRRIGDFNGDGRADFVARSYQGTVIALNNGDGTSFTQSVLPDGVHPAVGAVADLNHDGALDLLFIGYNDVLSTRFGNGDGTFGPSRPFSIVPPLYESGSTGWGVRTGDFDGDGELDLLHDLSFYLGRGDGTFDGFASVVAHYPQSFDVADFDGNGTDDVAVVTGGGDALTIIRTGIGPDPSLTATVGLTSTPDVLQYAQSGSHVATVTGGAIPPSGAVVFAVDGVPFALRELSALGSAVIAPGLPLGMHTITATYSGDDRYVSATATPRQQTVVRALTTVDAHTSSAPSLCGTEVTVFASLQAPRS